MIEALTQPFPVVPVPIIYPTWMNVVSAISLGLVCLALVVFVLVFAYVMMKETNKS